MEIDSKVSKAYWCLNCLINCRFLILFSEFAALDSTAKELGLGENIAIKLNRQGHPTMESFQMRPKCLKCVILCLESLFSLFGTPLKDVYLFGFYRGTSVVSKV